MLRRLARRLLPERGREALHVLLRREELLYSRPQASWEATKRRARGYSDPAVFEAVKQAALRVRDGEGAFERDSVVHRNLSFRWPLAGALLHIAGRRARGSGPPLHVIDFGGSLAGFYFQHRTLIEPVTPLLWSVIDLPHYVAFGNAELAGAALRFCDTIDEAAARAPPDAIVLSGVIEYLDDPYDFLTRAAGLGAPHLLIDRLHATDAADDEIRLQRTRPPVYRGSFAVRWLSRSKLVRHLDALGYGLVVRLPEGFWFERRAEAP